MTKPRTCLYIDESMTDPTGQYAPVLVVENEAGYHPTNYQYGTDYKVAKAIVAAANTTLGYTHEDTMTIVGSSIRAQNTQRGPGFDRPYESQTQDHNGFEGVWS